MTAAAPFDVVVFGSLNADLILLVAEHPKPGETVLCRESLLRPGGKGANQAVAAARAGASVAMSGCVGKDAFGALALEALEANAVDVARVVETADAVTGCASIAVNADGENIIYVASGANALARADMVPEALLRQSKIAVGQMEIDLAENWSFLARAKAAGNRTVLNLAPAVPLTGHDLLSLRQQVDVLVLNHEEARQLHGQIHGSFDGPPEQLAASLAMSLDTVCVITLGADGAVASNAREDWKVPSLAVEVVDTTGAGDTFTGVLAALLAEDRNFAEAIGLASAAASLACRKRGAQDAMPTRSEIASSLRHHSYPNF